MRTLSDAVIAAGCSTPDPSQLGQHHTLLSDDSHVSPPRLVGEENISPTKAARQVQPPRMLIEVQSDDGTDEASDTVDIPLPVAAQLGIPLSPMQTPVLSASNSPDGVARGRKPGPGSLNTRGPVLSRRLSASSTPVRSSPLNPNTTTAAALGQRDPSALARTPLLSDPPPGHEDVVDVTQFSTPPRTPFASVGLGADDDLVNMSNSFNFPPTTPESPPA